MRKLRFSKVKELLGQKWLCDSAFLVFLLARKFNHLYSLVINLDRVKKLSDLKGRKSKLRRNFPGLTVGSFLNNHINNLLI